MQQYFIYMACLSEYLLDMILQLKLVTNVYFKKKRISIFKYKDKFVIKGGVLLSSSLEII